MNKDKYFEEVEELIKNNKNVSKEDFELLFLAVSGVNIHGDIEFLADRIVKDLSSDTFKEVLVSWQFLQTEVGRAIVKAKFNVGNEIYLTSDLCEITGFSRAFISQEMKAGNIKYEKRKGTVFFRENDVKEYLSKKGIDKIDKENELKYRELKEKLINGDFEREADYK